MPDGLGLLDKRLVVLRIFAVRLAGAHPAPGVDEESGQVEVFLFAGDPIELDQAYLDLLVAGRVLAQARPNSLSRRRTLFSATARSVRFPVAS